VGFDAAVGDAAEFTSKQGVLGMSLLDKTRPFSIREYFQPVLTTGDRSFVSDAEAIERKAAIENHEFFAIAMNSREALKFWAAQEAIVTNPFSQILLHVIGGIKNVHIRSILMPVVAGEHSPIRNGIAGRSHPWLIWKLCRSLSLEEVDIFPSRAVSEFIATLESTVDEPMRALGALGIGNELMLLSEYKAVESCFEKAAPDAEYRDFLRANIGEDEEHTKLIGTAAAALTELGYDKGEFVRGAQLGVDARVAYYGTLLEEFKSQNQQLQR